MSQSQRRRDASMSLLTRITEGPLDPGYAAAAARGRQQTPARARLQSFLVLILAVAIGLGSVWAARQLRAPVDGALQARTVLEEQIRERSNTTDSLREDISGLNSDISELQSALPDTSDDQLTSLEYESVDAGTIPVRGAGVKLTVEDANRVVSGDDPARVFDSDIQLVVNGLWSAGAEAIAINGYRIGSDTAIRTAGEAILVNLKPLVSPYTIEAIGDPGDLRTRFARSHAAAHLSNLSSMYGISNSMVQAGKLELEAASTPSLDFVRQRE